MKTKVKQSRRIEALIYATLCGGITLLIVTFLSLYT
ncbi:hypothetical protein HNR74_000296 [Flammeovirga kamogawensis]|nr:hypothetical protein [Flammeovirga kamogawensis]